MLCNAKKTASSGSGYEKLEKCVTESGASSLLAAAKAKNDVRILTELSGKDTSAVIAYEVVYHRTCYRKYTKVERKGSGDQDKKEEVLEKFERYLDEHLIMRGAVS